ncbi:MAG TPA: hypothetical protein VIJ77_02710 [Candidatus Tumulicola sp.]
MKTRSSAKYALGVTAAVAILAGCSSSGGSQLAPMAGGGQSLGANHARGIVTLIPAQMRPIGALPLRGVEAPATAKKGIYVGQFYGTDIFGFTSANKGNKGPICTVSGVASVNSLAVDGKGNLLDPDGGSASLLVYNGPGMCGSLAATIADPYGQPSDASSNDALTGKIAVGNIFDTGSTPGSLSVCTKAKGCKVNLTNPNMNEVAGVLMDKKGNCWADATNTNGTATLTYFKKCAGKGLAATGFVNSSFGGLDMDTHGNLLAIDAFASPNGALYVYSGCTPACTKVGGPYALHGEAVFGHLNKLGTQFVTGDFVNGQVDIYTYKPTALTYKYSFNNGLTASLDVEGVAFNPRSNM